MLKQQDKTEHRDRQARMVGGGAGAGESDTESSYSEEDAAAEQRLDGPVNSSRLWDKGAVTQDTAMQIVQENEAAKRAKATAKELLKDQLEQKKEQARLAAAGVPDEVKQIVRQKGWVSGRGGIMQMLNQVVKQGDKVEDLILRCQQQMGWDEQTGFAG